MPQQPTSVTLTAKTQAGQRSFTATVHPRDISNNLRYQHDEVIDLTRNTETGFSTNQSLTAPAGLLSGLRSYTFLLTANAKRLTKQPRFYDFGCSSGNSVFLRANQLSAGIKLNGGTTTMVNGKTSLQVNRDYKLAVTFDAATKKTSIYIDGVLDASGTANQAEPYQLVEAATDSRNYIGRTQWWDSSYGGDNADFAGTIGGFRLYDIALTREEIGQVQNEIDGIQLVDSDRRQTADDSIYDLQGRRLGNDMGMLQHGIFISRGQKFVK